MVAVRATAMFTAISKSEDKVPNPQEIRGGGHIVGMLILVIDSRDTEQSFYLKTLKSGGNVRTGEH